MLGKRNYVKAKILSLVKRVFFGAYNSPSFGLLSKLLKCVSHGGCDSVNNYNNMIRNFILK